MTGFSCPAPLPARDTILLGHGSGGKLSAQLMQDIFLPAFANPILSRLDDQAALEINGVRLAFTTDSFVVKPLFFPGGDIGSLAVHGTINDLAMGGSRPLYLSAAFILEEGFSTAELRRIVDSMAAAARTAGVSIVTGDTKVVEKGSGDGVFINTTGIGVIRDGVRLSADQARPGDAVLLSGYVGDHGVTILAQREGLEIGCTVESDSAALHTLVDAMFGASEQAAGGSDRMMDSSDDEAPVMRDGSTQTAASTVQLEGNATAPAARETSVVRDDTARADESVAEREADSTDPAACGACLAHHGVARAAERGAKRESGSIDLAARGGLAESSAIRCLRDPTRGGLASTLNEIAGQSRVGIGVVESSIPVREEVRGVCELLGLDPLYVANEGKLVAIVAPEAAESILAAMRTHPLGRDAAIIGHVVARDPGLVTMRTAFGTTRIVDMLPGDQLPRIC